jgi:hypothetical protein
MQPPYVLSNTEQGTCTCVCVCTTAEREKNETISDLIIGRQSTKLLLQIYDSIHHAGFKHCSDIQ